MFTYVAETADIQFNSSSAWMDSRLLLYRLWCVDRRSAKRLKSKHDYTIHTIHIVLSNSMKSSVFKRYCHNQFCYLNTNSVRSTSLVTKKCHNSYKNNLI